MARQESRSETKEVVQEGRDITEKRVVGDIPFNSVASARMLSEKRLKC